MLKSKNFKKLLSIALACVMLVMCMGAYSKRDINIKVAKDESFRTEYPLISIYGAEKFFDKAKAPFLSKWNLNLVANYVNVNGVLLPNGDDVVWIRNCPKSYGDTCDNFRCGSGCSNDLLPSGHHKNAYKYFGHLKPILPLGSSDIVLTMSSYSTCYMEGSSHAYGPWGLAETNGEYSWIYASSDMNGWEFAQQQNIQHELSHIFGAGHCSNKINDPCIMSGGFGGMDTSLKTDI